MSHKTKKSLNLKDGTALTINQRGKFSVEIARWFGNDYIVIVKDKHGNILFRQEFNTPSSK